MTKEDQRPRYAWLDRIRGITLVSMIMYHAVWDCVYLFGLHCKWYTGMPGYLWQQSICWSFIMISGFCWSLGKRKFKRGLQVFCAGILISAVTLIAMPNSRIVFGVLTFLGSAMLFMIPLDKVLYRVPAAAGLGLNVVLFVCTRQVNQGYLGWGSLHFLELPVGMYKNWLTTYLGFPMKGFYSTDYFSIFPWFFLFLCGYYLYRLCGPLLVSLPESKWNIPVFDRMSRHTLIIYLLHQPLVYGGLFLLFLLF